MSVVVMSQPYKLVVANGMRSGNVSDMDVQPTGVAAQNPGFVPQIAQVPEFSLGMSSR